MLKSKKFFFLFFIFLRKKKQNTEGYLPRTEFGPIKGSCLSVWFQTDVIVAVLGAITFTPETKEVVFFFFFSSAALK